MFCSIHVEFQKVILFFFQFFFSSQRILNFLKWHFGILWSVRICRSVGQNSYRWVSVLYCSLITDLYIYQYLAYLPAVSGKI